MTNEVCNQPGVSTERVRREPLPAKRAPSFGLAMGGFLREGACVDLRGSKTVFPMTTLYLARPMHGAPFTHPVALARMQAAGVRLVSRPAQAQVIVSHNTKTLLPLRLRFPWKRFLVWTNEPRFDTHFAPSTSFAGCARLDVMNVYTGNVFWNNLHFLGSYHFNPDVPLGLDVEKPLAALKREDVRDFPRKTTAAIFSYRSAQETVCLKDGVNIDLEQMRIQCALTGHRRGMVDIYGKDWPDHLHKENSGYGYEPVRGTQAVPWWDRKSEILRDYHFNICLENTAYGYYCTEKIWHAIASRCLPIYHGRGMKIYESFPRESFLDSADFANFDQLFDAIRAMSLEEYLERMNLCIRAYNEACAQKRRTIGQSIQETTDRILAQLHGR